MSCYGPLTGFYSKDVNPGTGLRSIVFDARKSFSGVPVRIPCGKCVGCLKERARQWSVRAIHEARMSCCPGSFLTLTYTDLSLPKYGSLKRKDLTDFMKRLRMLKGSGIRFLSCGEYGSDTFRPHYHVLLFNVFFSDRKHWKNSNNGHALYRSQELECLWKLGDHYIGDVTPQSCGYVAKYITKNVDVPSEFFINRERPFQSMSRRPGLGYEWFVKYGDESYVHDDCIVDRKKVGLPKFYDKLLKRSDPLRLDQVRKVRRLEAMTPEARLERTRDRRLVREKLDFIGIERYAREV